MTFDKEYKMPLKDRIDLFLKMRKPFGFRFAFSNAVGKFYNWDSGDKK